MSALTEARNTREIAAGGISYTREFTVASGSTVYAGGIVAVTSGGTAIAAAAGSSGAIVAGRAENTASGGETVTTRSGVFLYQPVSSGAITVTSLNHPCYVSDDQTVTTSGGTAAVFAGIIRGVTSEGIAVEVGNGPLGFTIA